MKANSKYTVAEIVTEAGFKPEEVVGKVRVRVGGIPVNDPNKVISIQPKTKTLEIIVGQEKKEVTLEGDNEEKVISENAHAFFEATAEDKNKAFEAHRLVVEKKNTEHEETNKGDKSTPET